MTFLLYVKLAGCKQMGKQQKVLSRLHHLNSWFKEKNLLWIKNFWNQWYRSLPTPCRLFFEPSVHITDMFQMIKTKNVPFWFFSLQSPSPGVCTPWRRTRDACAFTRFWCCISLCPLIVLEVRLHQPSVQAPRNIKKTSSTVTNTRHTLRHLGAATKLFSDWRENKKDLKIYMSENIELRAQKKFKTQTPNLYRTVRTLGAGEDGDY